MNTNYSTGNIIPLNREPGADLTKEQMMPQQVIGADQCKKFTEELTKYKAGKTHLESRVTSAERWWTLRNEYEELKDTDKGDSDWGFKTKSSWLHNVLDNKHADYTAAYPMPNILAREDGDKVEAWALSKIVPAILKQNKFEKTYSDVGWQKMKTGTGIYKVTWDAKKLNGLGDISIKRRSLLNVYWEPGVADIQDSRYFFDVEQVDKEILIEEYPELRDAHLSNAVEPKKMPTEDHIDTENKISVIDVYYKKNGKLHYCKYVGTTVLYATENDNETYKESMDGTSPEGLPMMQPHTRAQDGLYAHGLYPYVFDILFPVEGSPCGYGYVDICANAMTRIDITEQAFIENTLVNATPRYFQRKEGAINTNEFLDLKKKIITVNGSLDDTGIMAVTGTGLSSNYIEHYTTLVEELRQTSGNTEAATGTASSGVTAASAIAALQEASGKLSRDATSTSYLAYQDIVYLVIELIRQFYDLPRQFRITGEMGMNKYIEFSNQGMQPQYQGSIGGVDMGYRVPVYDIDVVPEKRNSYTKIAQNELAIQLYGLGFFNPQMTDQAIMCLNMMDFDGKDELTQKISANGTMYQQLLMYQQLALTLAQKYEPGMVAGLSQNITGMPTAAPQTGEENGKVDLDKNTQEESSVTRNARERSNTAAQPGGSTK